MVSAQEFVDQEIANHKIVVFSKSYCPFCTMAKEAIASAGGKYHVVELENNKDVDAIQNVLMKMTGGRTV